MRKPLSMHCAAGSVIQPSSVMKRSYLLDVSMAEAECHNLRKPTLLDAEYVGMRVSLFFDRGLSGRVNYTLGNVSCRDSGICLCPTKAPACNETCCAKHTIT